MPKMRPIPTCRKTCCICARRRRVRQAARTQPAPSLLHQDLNLMQRVLRDMVDEHTASVRMDSAHPACGAAGVWPDLHAECGARTGPATSGDRPIFDLYNIDEEVAQAMGRRVVLESDRVSGAWTRPRR